MFSRLQKLALFSIVAWSAAGNAATYYVRNGGSDAADGLSHATAWASIDKVNSHSFKQGDNVLFHEGHSWNQKQLQVTWSGSSTAHAVVGSYYLEGGQAHAGVRGERPKLDGKGKVPATEYAPIVLVTGDYVRVENLAVVNSQGRGVVFDGTTGGQAVNLYLSTLYDGGIKFLDSKDGLAANNYVTESDRGWYQTGRDWSAAISATRSSRIVIRNNKIENVFGEGINIFQNSPDGLVEGNVIYGARAVGIYADASPRPTIRYNMVVGTSDSKYWRGSQTVGAGIAINNEEYHYQGHGGKLSTSVQTKDAKIYGNLVAYCSHGIGIWGALPVTSFDNTLIYNNTLVDNDAQFRSNVEGTRMPGSMFINNVLVSLSAGTRDIDVMRIEGLTARSNYFSQGDPGSPFSHSSNKYGKLELQRMDGWRTLTSASAVKWQDFQVKSGSSTIGVGDSLPVKSATDSQPFNLDFNRKHHNDPMDLGALRFGGARVPAAPKGLAGASQR